MIVNRLLGLVLLLGLAFPALGHTQEGQPASSRHPAYNLIGRDAPSPSSPLNPNFVVAEEAHLREGGFWRSSYINENLVGLSVADIDRDGQNEVVYASEKNIWLTRFSGNALTQLAKYSVPATQRIVSVDVFDVDGDGRLEIICSAQDENNAPISFILKFDGSTPTPLAQKLPWYLRVVGQGGSRFLAGQKAATGGTQVFTGGVQRVSLKGSSIASQGSVGLPEYVNLFNFVQGRLGSGGMMTAAIRFPSEHIFLYENKTRAWESREEYGGTMTYLAPQNYREAGDRRREFLPARLLLFDIDGDGQNELIVAKNDRGGVPFMSNQRAFTSGVIQAFKYQNLSLTPFFRTRTLPGAVVDLQLADFKNNGTLSLIAAVLTQPKSGMLSEGLSLIVAYDISVSAAEAAPKAVRGGQ
ncbi:MAG: FG-GAP-like repeat-containing protein [Candidatus Adiutrix sp.]|jgi:hypothetical protein|nr:FG-GAP-like repeat-containing protein [Candidatus Adiutrix sp.]